MLSSLVLLAVLMVLGVLYKVFIAPRKWVKKYGDGCYNPVVKFNKQNLGIKKENV